MAKIQRTGPMPDPELVSSLDPDSEPETDSAGTEDWVVRVNNFFHF
jgi:hypothetical protein